jgi:aminoglycoside 2''-phosphotransferase
MLGDMGEERVRAVVVEALPELAEASLEPLGEGFDSVAWLVGGRYVLRFPRHAEAAERIAREAPLLAELGRSLPVASPRVSLMAANPFGPGSCYGHPLVPGESLQPEEWLARELREPERRVAAILDAIHAFPVERARELKVGEWDLRADYAEAFQGVRDEVAGRLTSQEAHVLLSRWEAYLGDDANFAYRPTLLHADFSLDHLLVDDTEITGLIDFGDSMIGDPDYDLCYLWDEAGPGFVRRVVEHRGDTLTPVQMAKLDFWAMAELANDVRLGIGGDETFIELRTKLAPLGNS